MVTLLSGFLSSLTIIPVTEPSFSWVVMNTVKPFCKVVNSPSLSMRCETSFLTFHCSSLNFLSDQGIPWLYTKMLKNDSNKPKMMAGTAHCIGLMPADFITTSSRSDNMRLYTNKMAAKTAIGDKMVKIRGINKDVSSANMLTGIPLLVIKSTKRKDWVNQMMDIKEKVTNKKPTNICLIM